MIRFHPIIYITSLLVGILALFMLLPLGVAMLEGDLVSAKAFGGGILLALLLCASIYIPARAKFRNLNLRTREGFILVSLAWIAASAIGALPFVFSGAIPTYTDAFFETMSGFSTTGASILPSIETLPRAMLFWRSLTHWLGGMGIVVLTVAVLPFLGVGGVQLVRAEAPGPTLDKVAPKITQTAKILWFIYLGLTLLETILLMCVGMSLFDALTHTFGTLATGGFSPRNAGVGVYDSAAVDCIITVFMVMAGINFGLYHKVLSGHIRDVFRNTELRVYLAIYGIATLIIALSLLDTYGTFRRAFRFAGFQAASIITTTGYATADFDFWPTATKGVLFFLMFIGGCSGSTGGGPKVVRIVGLFKLAWSEMKYLARPLGVFHIRLNGNIVKKSFLYPLAGFFFLYIACLLGVTIIVMAFGVDFTTGFTTALATVGNIGPGFGQIGPTLNYGFYHPFVKWVLSTAMLAGRLEIYTVFILFSRSFWSRR